MRPDRRPAIGSSGAPGGGAKGHGQRVDQKSKLHRQLVIQIGNVVDVASLPDALVTFVANFFESFLIFQLAPEAASAGSAKFEIVAKVAANLQLQLQTNLKENC